MSEVAGRHRAELEELLSGSRRQAIEAARRDVAQIAVKKLGMSAAELARHLGVSTPCISRIVAKGVISETTQEIVDKWDT